MSLRTIALFAVAGDIILTRIYVWASVGLAEHNPIVRTILVEVGWVAYGMLYFGLVVLLFFAHQRIDHRAADVVAAVAAGGLAVNTLANSLVFVGPPVRIFFGVDEMIFIAVTGTVAVALAVGPKIKTVV